MVKKMILRGLLLTVLFFTIPFSADSVEIGFPAIAKRNFVACGIDSDYNHLARKQDGIWSGLDADMCRAIAQAILQDSESFRLIPVKNEKIGKMLNSGLIDVMLGHLSLPIQFEALQNIQPTDVIYYDRLVFAARHAKSKNSTSKSYHGAKVCVQDNSVAFEAAKRYNTQYALGFNFIRFPQTSAVKAAFYLNRCDLVAGDEVFITGIINDLKNNEAKVLNDEMAIIPIRYYTSGNNSFFNLAINSIFNALKLAATEGVMSSNLETFNAESSTNIRNILGLDGKFWSRLHLQSDWLPKYIHQYGNYDDILNRNIGFASPLKLNMSINQPYNKGGHLITAPLF